MGAWDVDDLVEGEPEMLQDGGISHPELDITQPAQPHPLLSTSSTGEPVESLMTGTRHQSLLRRRELTRTRAVRNVNAR